MRNACFGWYLRGPYSTGLTQYAFALKDELASGSTEHQRFHLTPEVTKTLDKAKDLWSTPARFTGGDDDWL
jgi:uncharacterized protein YwgA